ncbi:MAG: acyl carrier protein [Candidatus Thermoplasmatota archaeon]|nr:acyl carrier protein [Candidatus Thermoplasmatota archaeon]
MNRDMIAASVLESIRKETSFTGDISENDNADSIDGWDSIAHIRIMYRIDFSLNVEIDLLETYSCETIGDLIDLIRTKAGE